ncbi:hypothetical protein U9M48_036701 [Paspalum notatum var. saurae]|uniref:C2H2-type domain-containing protein n=1 Tax=Paspalum notatum var. saurae TaxID=547442 RepID=A0AAQ3UHP0_PASNO
MDGLAGFLRPISHSVSVKENPKERRREAAAGMMRNTGSEGQPCSAPLDKPFPVPLPRSALHSRTLLASPPPPARPRFYPAPRRQPSPSAVHPLPARSGAAAAPSLCRVVSRHPALTMEFWGLEVKPGTTVKCDPEDGYILHLSQAALGESKKSDSALMFVKVDNQKLALGTLSTDKYPQIQFDLVFDKEFELSHTSKAATVFFSGYKVVQPDEEELNVPVLKENGKAEVKTDAAASKSSAVAKDIEKKSKDDDDSDEDETDDSDEDEGLSPEEGDDDETSDEEDSSEDDEDSDEDEEEQTPTPKKPEAGKKRAAENALKTPLSDKKAKAATPSGQKTGGKKGAAPHVATPHPAKQAGKTPADSNKSKEKSPKSGGSFSCKSCSKTFNSEMALTAHSKAKHGAK